MGLQSKATDDSISKGLIKARHGHADSVFTGQDDCPETPEEVAAKFSGTCKRLTASRAALVYWQSGGMLFGMFCLFVFAFTQTTRIMGDWWIRCVFTAYKGA
jgi:hypothetical protein